MINEANEPSSACRLWRIYQVETSTRPKSRTGSFSRRQRLRSRGLGRGRNELRHRKQLQNAALVFVLVLDLRPDFAAEPAALRGSLLHELHIINVHRVTGTRGILAGDLEPDLFVAGARRRP